MPVSKKPRHKYKPTYDKSLGRHSGATKILNLISKGTEGDVACFDKLVHHMLSCYNQRI